eukprot:352449-Chlamydomonas_euryale.AAC.1
MLPHASRSQGQRGVSQLGHAHVKRSELSGTTAGRDPLWVAPTLTVTDSQVRSAPGSSNSDYGRQPNSRVRSAPRSSNSDREAGEVRSR